MNPSTLLVVALLEDLTWLFVGEETCKLPDFAESLLLLLDGVKASTAGLSLGCNLLGVTGCTGKGAMMGIASPEAEEDEAFVALLSMFVEMVTARSVQQEYQRLNGSHVQGEKARVRCIRSNDSFASRVPLTIGRPFDLPGGRMAICKDRPLAGVRFVD